MIHHYHTICQLLLIPKEIGLSKWSGQYLIGSDWNYDTSISYEDSIDPVKTDYGKVVSSYADEEEKVAFVEIENEQLVSFHIPDLQEVDFGILQKSGSIYIIRFCLEPEFEIEEVLDFEYLANFADWKEEGNIDLNGGDYLLMDSACHHSDVELEDIPTLQIPSGKYHVATAIFGEEELVVHRITGASRIDC